MLWGDIALDELVKLILFGQFTDDTEKCTTTHFREKFICSLSVFLAQFHGKMKSKSYFSDDHIIWQ